MTECSGCGQCCEVVELSVTRAEVDDGRARVDERTRQWVMDELKPLNPRIAYERAPWLKARRGQLRIGAAGSVLRFFYECSNYDRETKRCMAYDDRPPACRAFPTKVTGRWPDGRVSLPPACSYRADVGLPIETGDGA